MNTITKLAIATGLICGGANLAMAQGSDTESAIDPSNITAVNTSGYIGLSNQGDVKLSASMGIGLSNGQMAMTTLEGGMDKDGNYSDSRLQYFHVFDVNNAVLPTAAASLDIIDNQSFTTAALGGVVMINPSPDNLLIFGRVGALAGTYDDDFATQMGVTDTNVVGGMAAAYFSWKPGADGTYLMFSPEYTYMDGDIETSLLKTSLTVGTPLSADGKRWGQFKLENSYGSMESSSKTLDIDETAAWVYYKVFF